VDVGISGDPSGGAQVERPLDVQLELALANDSITWETLLLR
jgi:hypothetical protein